MSQNVIALLPYAYRTWKGMYGWRKLLITRSTTKLRTNYSSYS